MTMERTILCLLCGIMAGLLIGWGIWKYTEKRRRKRLPACEVRKAPKVLYVPEKDVRGDGPATDGTAAPPEQKEPVPSRSQETFEEAYSTECFFGVRRSNPNQRRSPALQHTPSAQGQRKQEQQSVAWESGLVWKCRLWLAVSIFCCGGIVLLQTGLHGRNRKTPGDQGGS